MGCLCSYSCSFSPTDFSPKRESGCDPRISGQGFDQEIPLYGLSCQADRQAKTPCSLHSHLPRHCQTRRALLWHCRMSMNFSPKQRWLKLFNSFWVHFGIFNLPLSALSPDTSYPSPDRKLTLFAGIFYWDFNSRSKAAAVAGYSVVAGMGGGGVRDMTLLLWMQVCN